MQLPWLDVRVTKKDQHLQIPIPLKIRILLREVTRVQKNLQLTPVLKIKARVEILFMTVKKILKSGYLLTKRM